jgi:hypothetical protein
MIFLLFRLQTSAVDDVAMSVDRTVDRCHIGAGHERLFCVRRIRDGMTNPLMQRGYGDRTPVNMDRGATKMCLLKAISREATRSPWLMSRTRDATKDAASVQFEITPATREALHKWIKQAGLKSEDFLFPSRIHDSPHLGTRQYARILEGWVEELGLDPADYGTHSMRRTKATLIYRRTKNLRAVQLLLGHLKLESTVRYLGIEVDDALEISEQTEI